MNCYVCDRRGRVTAAVALCRGCDVALCRRHLDEALLAPGPGGTEVGCRHDPAAWARESGAARTLIPPRPRPT